MVNHPMIVQYVQNLKSNWFLLSIPTAVVIATTLLLSSGTIGTKLFTAICVGTASAACNVGAISSATHRLKTKLEVTTQKLYSMERAQQIDTKIPHSQGKLQKLQLERKNLEEIIQQKKIELNNQKIQLNHVKGQLAEIKEEYAKLKQEVTSLTEKKIDLESQFSQLVKEINNCEF